MFKSIPNDKPIRLAFLGCGAITKDHTQYARHADPSIQLSFASRTANKSEEYTSRFKGVTAFPNYESAIRSEDINVIMINTPPDSHFELVKKSLDAGKHVIVEKPPLFKQFSIFIFKGS